MNRQQICLTLKATRAVKRLRKDKIGLLPALDKRQRLGILTRPDVLWACLRLDRALSAMA